MVERKKGSPNVRQLEFQVQGLKLEKNYPIIYHHPKTALNGCKFGHGYFKKVMPNHRHGVMASTPQEAHLKAPELTCRFFHPEDGCDAVMIKTNIGSKIKS